MAFILLGFFISTFGCRVIKDFDLCKLGDLWRHIVNTKWCKITKYGISVQVLSLQGVCLSLLGECQLTPSQLLGRKRRHERPGSEALLHKQAKEKKQGTPTRQQTVSTLRCTYSPGGNRCTEKVMPLTKHCMKRILFMKLTTSQELWRVHLLT